MPRKPSRETLETRLRDVERRELAFYDLLRASNIPPGWRFVVGPRGMRSALMHVDPQETFNVQVYEVEELTSDGWQRLESSLYRQCEHDADFPSLLAAFEDARAWRSSNRSWLGAFARRDA